MKKITISLLLLLILSYFSISALLKIGYFTMHDDTQIARVYEMKNSLQDGMFPVRWVENLGFGYGYPIFNFYAPLPYYLGGFINILGVDSISSTKLMFGIGTLLSGISMFFFLRKFFNPLASIVGGIVYLYFPYHAVNIYIRAAVGEYFAYAFLPLVFLSLYSFYELFKKKKNFPIGNIFLFSFSVFLVTVSHNLSAFMMILMTFVFTVISIFSVKYKRNFLISIIAGLVLGIGLSAFYFLPAVLESGYTNVSSQVGGGADYKNHFVCVSQYWNSMWGFGGSVPGCIDGLSFKLGKQNIVLFTLSLILMAYIFIRKKKLKNIALINFILFFAAFFLTLSYSKIIWDTVPFMSYLQYPWRFINFIALFLTFSIAYFLFKSGKIFGQTVMVMLGALIILVTIIFNAKLFNPQFITNNPESYYTDSRHINFDVSRLSSEYMPKDFIKPQSEDELPEVFLSSSEVILASISKKTNKIIVEYKAFKDEEVHLNLAYFPAWHVFVNGEEVEIRKDIQGMNIVVPAGEGKIEVIYKETFVEKLGNIITICSFITIIAGIMYSLYKQKRSIISLRRLRKHGK